MLSIRAKQKKQRDRREDFRLLKPTMRLYSFEGPPPFNTPFFMKTPAKATTWNELVLKLSK